tara:strand:+ start:302 stop:526 length:225 start_codon:yes stop_codon:yes gene_type:complete
MKKNNLLLIIIIIINIGISSVYNVGDNISIEHQNILFDICYGQDEQENLKLSNFNGENNGGNYKIMWIDMAAAW